MSQDQRTREGYLLLADFSGYTAFLVGTELEHANAIVHELTSLIRQRLSPPMRFVKLAVTTTSDGLAAVHGLFHAAIAREADLCSRFSRVHVCRRFELSLSS